MQAAKVFLSTQSIETSPCGLYRSSTATWGGPGRALPRFHQIALALAIKAYSAIFVWSARRASSLENKQYTIVILFDFVKPYCAIYSISQPSIKHYQRLGTEQPVLRSISLAVIYHCLESSP